MCFVFRKEIRTITLKNPTTLPVAWHLTGVENLGDDFICAEKSGVVEPRSTFIIHLTFHAIRPLVLVKKTVKIEVRLSTQFGR
jgi:hydrocephalus-inducing protein